MLEGVVAVHERQHAVDIKLDVAHLHVVAHGGGKAQQLAGLGRAGELGRVQRNAGRQAGGRGLPLGVEGQVAEHLQPAGAGGDVGQPVVDGERGGDAGGGEGGGKRRLAFILAELVQVDRVVAVVRRVGAGGGQAQSGAVGDDLLPAELAGREIADQGRVIRIAAEVEDVEALGVGGIERAFGGKQAQPAPAGAESAGQRQRALQRQRRQADGREPAHLQGVQRVPPHGQILNRQRFCQGQARQHGAGVRVDEQDASVRRAGADHRAGAGHRAHGRAWIDAGADAHRVAVGRVHQGQAGFRVRHRHRAAGQGHGHRRPRRVQVRHADRIQAAGDVEQADARRAVGGHHEVVDRGHIRGRRRGRHRGQDAGAGGQAAQRVRALSDLHAVGDEIAVGVGQRGAGPDHQLGQVRQAVVVGVHRAAARGGQPRIQQRALAAGRAAVEGGLRHRARRRVEDTQQEIGVRGQNQVGQRARRRGAAALDHGAVILAHQGEEGALRRAPLAEDRAAGDRGQLLAQLRPHRFVALMRALAAQQRVPLRLECPDLLRLGRIRHVVVRLAGKDVADLRLELQLLLQRRRQRFVADDQFGNVRVERQGGRLQGRRAQGCGAGRGGLAGRLRPPRPLAVCVLGVEVAQGLEVLAVGVGVADDLVHLLKLLAGAFAELEQLLGAARQVAEHLDQPSADAHAGIGGVEGDQLLHLLQVLRILEAGAAGRQRRGAGIADRRAGRIAGRGAGIAGAAGARARAVAVPAGLADADTGIALHEQAVFGDRHRSDDLPFPGVMVERPERGLGPRRQLLAGCRIGQIGEANRHRRVKIAGAVGLDRHDHGQLQAGRQRARQAAGVHRGQAQTAATGAVIGEQRVRRHEQARPLHLRKLLQRLLRQADFGLLRLADPRQAAGPDVRQVDHAAGGVLAVPGQVVGTPGRRLPAFADARVVAALGVVAQRAGAAVDMDEKAAGGAGAQNKVPLGVGDGAQGLFGTVHRDGHAGQRHVGAAGILVAGQDAATDRRAGDGGDAQRVKAEFMAATAGAVTVRIDRPAKQVRQTDRGEGHPHAGVGRQRLQVKQRRPAAVGRDLHPREDAAAAELGMELRGVERGIQGQRHGEVQHGFTGHGHVGFAGGG